ncbi:MAG TPA: hypothetical protein VK428_08985 [Acidimicrobiales bacterium]|nr:hypothetical protein [Acidimicrobiales bacterium]
MEKGYPVERFDPLLRNLVAFDLVVRNSPGRRPAWRLTEAVQRRLDELIEPAAPMAAEQMVYLDHRCADCQQRCPTRVHEGLYLCEKCLQARTAPVVQVAAPQVAKTRWRRPRQGMEGSSPVAS